MSGTLTRIRRLLGYLSPLLLCGSLLLSLPINANASELSAPVQATNYYNLAWYRVDNTTNCSITNTGQTLNCNSSVGRSTISNFTLASDSQISLNEGEYINVQIVVYSGSSTNSIWKTPKTAIADSDGDALAVINSSAEQAGNAIYYNTILQATEDIDFYQLSLYQTGIGLLTLYNDNVAIVGGVTKWITTSTEVDTASIVQAINTKATAITDVLTSILNQQTSMKNNDQARNNKLDEINDKLDALLDAQQQAEDNTNDWRGTVEGWGDDNTSDSETSITNITDQTTNYEDRGTASVNNIYGFISNLIGAITNPTPNNTCSINISLPHIGNRTIDYCTLSVPPIVNIITGIFLIFIEYRLLRAVIEQIAELVNMFNNGG